MALASFFFPGLGQVLAGQPVKGLLIFVCAMFTCGGFGFLPFLAAADAFMIAQRKNRGEAVGPYQIF